MANHGSVSHGQLRERLARLVKGPVLGAGDPAYEESRRVFNAMIDRRPAAIVRCSCAEDVAHGVTVAREYDLPLSVKGGGHSVAGNAVCDGGLMLDMSAMKAISVDPERDLAVAEAGLTLGDFDAATARYGLATTLGVVSMTGIAGLTLGGGIGWLNGKHGLACDNVLSMEVVTADGQLRTVNVRPAPGPVLGPAGRRRQLRGRRVLHLPPAPRQHGPRRPDQLPAGAGGRRAAPLPSGGCQPRPTHWPPRHRWRAAPTGSRPCRWWSAGLDPQTRVSVSCARCANSGRRSPTPSG